MKNSSIMLLLVMLFLGCSNEDDEPATQIPASFFNTPVVNTGYYAYDQNGSLIRVLGLPNTQREIKIGLKSYSMVTFPNPVWYNFPGTSNQGNGSWVIGLSPSFVDKTGKAWLVRASTSFDSDPFVAENGTYFQNLGENLVVWEGTYQGQQLRIEAPSNEDADYRLYIEVEDGLLYDNLVVREYLTY